VGALEKCEHGPVTYDTWKCIGCRYCLVACPYQVPAYEYNNALTPQVRKCTFCHERLQKGQRPACVEICPAEALTFGKRRELIDLARSKIKKNPDLYVDHIYGEHEIGGSSWMYLASTDFVNTELPELGTDPIPSLTEHIQHGIFKSFIPPIALYGLLGLIMYSTRHKNEKQESEDERP
jgi:Fe-S-cluster-containing dehydrogenase component